MVKYASSNRGRIYEIEEGGVLRRFEQVMMYTGGLAACKCDVVLVGSFLIVLSIFCFQISNNQLP
jgi:hypothetical protein